ncbi:peptidase inhibitor family I36 protein [Streptomyces sp. NBC_00280]|uniref:peptidase inhibitor family I36 protein n=1 Tax=Streptomyces sp. NBC_00280 TaxID=2975699 RepID=UPI003243DB49
MTNLRQGVAVLAGAVGLLAATMVVPASASASVPAATGQALGALAPSCPDNWFCFYDGTNWVTRGRLSDCGWQNLANWGWQNRIESTYNNTDDWVWYEDVATGNGWWDAPRTYYASVPYPNTADWVYREC